MSNQKHYMIDIETLDTRATACVLSIGAVKFNPFEKRNDYINSELFYSAIDPTSARIGRTVGKSTIAWWNAQSKEAKEAAFSGTDTVKQALDGLSQFIDGNGIVWGNGSSFDISILDSLFDQYGMQTPWKFWNVRDVRTLVDLAGHKGFIRPSLTKGVAHNALDDAKHQASYVCDAYKVLLG